MEPTATSFPGRWEWHSLCKCGYQWCWCSGRWSLVGLHCANDLHVAVAHSRILVAVGHSVAVRVDEHADMDPRSAIGWCYMTCSYDCSAV